MFRNRRLSNRLHRLIEHVPVVVLTGARQVGKSTLLAHELPDWDRVVLDPVTDIEGARADPALFLANRPAPLVIDEVQCAPEIVPALKRRVDERGTPGQYVLTGSQQWEVLRGLAESLAGRAVFLHLEGFGFSERADGGGPWLNTWLDGEDLMGWRSFGLPLYETLWRGALPRTCLSPLDVVPALHEGYHRTYVERDVRLLRDISDAALFGRFVRLMAAHTAQEINATQIGRELGIARTTAQSWLDLLRATWQWYELPAWSGNVVKRVSGKPKGHVGDTGAACWSQAISTHRAIGAHPMQGALFETAGVNDIRRQAALLATPPRLWHWRSHGGAEVDLVMERDGRLFPVEFKATTTPGRKDVRGITAFRTTHGDPVGPGLLVCAVERPRWLTHDVLAIPWDLGHPGEHPTS